MAAGLAGRALDGRGAWRASDGRWYYRGLRPVPLLILFALVWSAAPVRPATAAPVTSPITSRDYAVDLYTGVAMGTPRTVSMGGAATALAEGALGPLANMGATARRPLSAQGTWDWDLALDQFYPQLGADVDNNGMLANDTRSAHVSSGALTGHYRSWALGLGASTVTYRYGQDSPPLSPIELSATVARIALARSFAEGTWNLGLGLRLGSFAVQEAGTDTTLFEANGGALELGVLHAPAGRSFRLGLRAGRSVRADTEQGSCDPASCRGRILPTHAVAPWEVALGWTVRLAGSTWNTPTGQPGAPSFRDEKALIVSADLLLVGALSGAGGVEAFGENLYQRSGAEVTLSPRLGAELEWLPGRLRGRAGSYWEPPRFQGIGGRLHVTFGAELRLFAFHLWGTERRVAVSTSGDLARHYGNLGLSFGFWH